MLALLPQNNLILIHDILENLKHRTVSITGFDANEDEEKFHEKLEQLEKLLEKEERNLKQLKNLNNKLQIVNTSKSSIKSADIKVRRNIDSYDYVLTERSYASHNNEKPISKKTNPVSTLLRKENKENENSENTKFNTKFETSQKHKLPFNKNNVYLILSMLESRIDDQEKSKYYLDVFKASLKEEEK